MKYVVGVVDARWVSLDPEFRPFSMPPFPVVLRILHRRNADWLATTIEPRVFDH
jgi:hypothetical protein